jgi:hypothetical protein
MLLEGAAVPDSLIAPQLDAFIGPMSEEMSQQFFWH